MRNVFDQFESRENRLTHALLSALAHDRKLLRAFLNRYAPKFRCDVRALRIEEQTLPGEPAPRLPEERRGLPDAVLWDKQGHLLAIEAKVTARLTVDQLRRHVRTLVARDFKKPHGMVITLRAQELPLRDWVHVRWLDLYRWLCGYRRSPFWGPELARYIEIVETQMADAEIDAGVKLTDFSGIHFSDQLPYSYHAAKITLRKLLDAITDDRKSLRALGFNGKPDRRGLIMDQPPVWDFLAIKAGGRNHTSNLHYTAGIGPQFANAYITIPNGTAAAWRKLRGGGLHELRRCTEVFLSRLGRLAKSEGISPEVVLLQRHYKTQRSGVVDARLTFDPRAAVEKWAGRVDAHVKYQPQWLDLAFALISEKRSNLQFQIGCRFDYGRCTRLSRPDATSLFVQTWLAAKESLAPYGLSVRGGR